MVNRHGVPLAIRTAGANASDHRQILPLVLDFPKVGGKPGRPKELPDEAYADRGYDSDPTRELLRWLGIEPHIARRRTPHGSGLGKVRWVVERTISWLKGLRRLRVRYDRLGVIMTPGRHWRPVSSASASCITTLYRWPGFCQGFIKPIRGGRPAAATRSWAAPCTTRRRRNSLPPSSASTSIATSAQAGSVCSIRPTQAASLTPIHPPPSPPQHRAGIRDLKVDAAGNLYYLSGTGLIRRISYVPSSTTDAPADTTTQGTWKGVYGAGGYNVVANQASYPSYASVAAPAGNKSYTWSVSTTDVRALPKAAAGATDRVAAAWFSPTGFTVDVNLTDGQAHKSEPLLRRLGRLGTLPAQRRGDRRGHRDCGQLGTTVVVPRWRRSELDRSAAMSSSGSPGLTGANAVP